MAALPPLRQRAGLPGREQCLLSGPCRCRRSRCPRECQVWGWLCGTVQVLGGARGASALFGMAAVMSQDGPASPLRWTSVLVRLLGHRGPRRWLWRCACGRRSRWGCGGLPDGPTRRLLGAAARGPVGAWLQDPPRSRWPRDPTPSTTSHSRPCSHTPGEARRPVTENARRLGSVLGSLSV